MIAPQDRDDGGLGWLFQLVAVFVFFVLPVIRSITESRKRGGKAQRAPKPPQPKAQPEGRDLWRELLEGRGPEPPAKTPAPPQQQPKPKAPRPPVTREPLTPAPAPLSERVEPAPPPRRPAPQRAAHAPVARPLAPLAETPRMEPRVAPRLAAPLGGLAGAELDPATLDDELARRWGGPATPAEAPAARTPAAAALLGGLDWRRAVLLSEVLAPPLALRGPAAAWPGPPASLTS